MKVLTWHEGGTLRGTPTADTPADASDPRVPRLDYVVVAFRSERHLSRCLDAIEADRPDGAGVIVIDNASPDASAAIAHAHRSHPTVIVSRENLGFGGGCNLALEVSTADFLFFVNPDVRLRPGVTEGLMATMQADTTVAAIGPLIADPTSELRAASAGSEPSLRSVVGHFLLLGRAPVIGHLFAPLQLPFGSSSQPVDWVSGAALMVRTNTFRHVGGFDASMFMYMEDVDLCRRLRALNLTIKYEAGVSVEHELGGSQGTEQPQRWYAAFHRYLAGQRGPGYARVASAIAAVGLGLRAVALSATRPAHSRRLARAARLATVLAVGSHRELGLRSEA